MTQPFIDYDSPIGQVRALVADMSVVTQGRLPHAEAMLIFNDEQIRAYLTINKGNVRRAAADAVGALAIDEVLMSKVIKTEDLQTDGAKVAEALRKYSADLRKRADEEESREHGFFTVPGVCSRNYVDFGIHLQE